MNNYLINNIETNEFKKIITLLNYDEKLSDILKTINLSSLKGKTILIDTALVAGVNEYRFIESKVTDEGYLNLNEYKYVDVDLNILDFANNIIRNNPNSLSNSILTISQKEEI